MVVCLLVWLVGFVLVGILRRQIPILASITFNDLVSKQELW